MADRRLIDDAYRAYAYFRWVDDTIDEHTTSQQESLEFLERQKMLIDRTYQGERITNLLDQEAMLADLVLDHPHPNGKLHSYIHHMMEVMEFDANRRGELISAERLAWYSATLSRAVMDAIQHFIGNRCDYPTSDQRTHAAIGAHIAHMLRDTFEDTQAGFVNIPREYLERHRIQPTDFTSAPFRAWVQGRVELAWDYYRTGRQYFNSIDNLRCRIVGYWYCARFENVLRTIDREGYILRSDYPEQRYPSAWMRMFWLAFSLPVKHILVDRMAAQATD
jgi:phytoene/squalene synthetase